MKISYNWLQNYFEEKLPEPNIIAEGIIFHSFEVEGMEKLPPLSPTDSSPQAGEQDTIFDMKVLPDRNHDCLSHWGIAKEVSAIFDLKIKDKELKIFDSKETNLNIQIEDKKCLRYMGRIVRNINVGESPEWLKVKLNAIGQKSINNIVNAANFVMFDLGQPIHVFDLDKLESEKIIIRNAKVGEKIMTLDKKEINLDNSILVIADEKYPLAIAGIKGGTKAEVDNNTKNIVIEVANFNPTTTRKTAKKINIQTDAVKRYENEISPELCSKVMDEITSMIFNLAGGEVENIVDIYPKKQGERNIKVTVDYINKRLGSDFSKEEIESVWKKLNFIYTELAGEFDIKVPMLRLDLIGPHDLTEEVIRILGYDRLPEKLLKIKNDKKLNKTFYKILLARNKLLSDGYSEVMSYVFKEKGDVEVLASANGKNFLRNNLSDGLKESIQLNNLNLPLLDMKEVKVFEIGTVFFKDKEVMNVAYGDKKNVVEMSLEEFIKEKVLEEIPADKKSSPEVHGYFSAEKFLVLGSTASQGTSGKDFHPQVFKPWSLFPFISRDIAVWVTEGEDKEKLKNIFIEEGTDLLVKEPYLFDSFSKDGRTSYAYRLVFQSYERTLKDEEVNFIMSNIEEKIYELGWVVR